MNPFPESDQGDAIGRWLLSLPWSQREKLFRLADYMNGNRGRLEAIMPTGNGAPSVEKYRDGICEFPGGKKSVQAEQLAELLARAIAGEKIEERKAA